MPREPALLTSAGRMPERSQHRASEGQDARSERPATGHGQPRTAAQHADPVAYAQGLYARDRARRSPPPPPPAFAHSTTPDGPPLPYPRKMDRLQHP